jgi:hypothetical protein
MSIGEQDKEEKSVQQGLHPACPCQKQNVVAASKRSTHADEFTSRLREGLLLVSCVQEALRRWPNSLNSKNQRRNCRWKKKTYFLVTNSYNGYVGVVQEFEVNLWVKDKYERRTQHAENVQAKHG